MFWDCDVNENVEMINLTERVNTIKISPTGRFIAVGNDFGEVLIYETENKNFSGKVIEIKNVNKSIAGSFPSIG